MIPKSRGDLFIRVHNMIKCEKLDICLNRRSPELIKIVQKCLGHILEHEELNDAALKYVDNFCKQASLNTQSSIKGFLVVRDFCFWAIWAAGPILKKVIWVNHKQLLRAVFSCFQGHFFSD